MGVWWTGAVHCCITVWWDKCGRCNCTKWWVKLRAWCWLTLKFRLSQCCRPLLPNPPNSLKGNKVAWDFSSCWMWGLTSDSDVDAGTGCSLCGLTPVNSTVPCEDVADVTEGTSWFPPSFSTLSPGPFSCVPRHHPSIRAVAPLTPQRDRLSFKQLRAVRTDLQSGWRTTGSGCSG